MKAELRVPAFTAYLDPDPNGARVTKETGINEWDRSEVTASWFGEFKSKGELEASLEVRLPRGKRPSWKLSVAGEIREGSAPEETPAGVSIVKFGRFTVKEAGYVKFTLSSSRPAGEIDALLLDGAAAKDAHFNLLPRRNAASVHLTYSVPEDAEIAAFYNEVTAIEDPVATYYMACGFSRGYFGMQVNSEKERRIIFSVWDSGAGTNAKDRSSVAKTDQVSILEKGNGVEAGGFGNEGTGGHSHLVYPWKTGEAQRFTVTAQPTEGYTDYAGFWFHPEKKKWMLIASFRAPRDGKWLRGLYSFSENFNGNNGHLQRKALFGPQWMRSSNGNWREIKEASFSHDPTGKEDRLDRFMGEESGLFFLSQGGFVPGFTKFGDKFTRPASGKRPDFTPPGQ